MTLIYETTYINATKVLSMRIENCVMETKYKDNGWWKPKTKIEIKGHALKVDYVNECGQICNMRWSHADRNLLEPVFQELLSQIRAQDSNFMDELFEKAIKQS